MFMAFQAGNRLMSPFYERIWQPVATPFKASDP